MSTFNRGKGRTSREGTIEPCQIIKKGLALRPEGWMVYEVRCERSSVLLQEMLRHNTRRLNDALFFRTNHQPDEFRHAPGERRGAPCAAAEHKSRLTRVRLIPDLLRNHAALVCELQHRVQIQTWVTPRR